MTEEASSSAAAEPLDAVDEDGCTKLFVAAKLGQEDEVHELLAAGARAGQASPDGCSPLWIAAQQGAVGCVRAILAAAADVDQRSALGATPLWAAAQNGSVVCARALVQAGADVNACDDLGYTPLCVAARHGNGGVAQMLLSAKADPGIACQDGATALSLAAEDPYISALLLGEGHLTISNSFNGIDQMPGGLLISNLSFGEMSDEFAGGRSGGIPSVFSSNALSEAEGSPEVRGHLPSSFSCASLDELAEPNLGSIGEECDIDE